MEKLIECDCGWTCRGSDEHLIAECTVHARDVHGLARDVLSAGDLDAFEKLFAEDYLNRGRRSTGSGSPAGGSSSTGRTLTSSGSCGSSERSGTGAQMDGGAAMNPAHACEHQRIVTSWRVVTRPRRSVSV